MAEYGLTDTGFRLKRLRDILDSVKREMSSVKDPDSGQTLDVNWNEDDPFIQFMQITCDELSSIWEIMNSAYDQFNPLNATGPVLSSLVQLNGIQRKQGSPSTVFVEFVGSVGYVVPAHTIVSDEDEEVRWETVRDATVSPRGSVLSECRSVYNGAYYAPAGSVNKLISNLDGITSIINPLPSNPGTENESDYELRRRRSVSTETPSRGLAESIQGAISSIPGVIYCKIYTNRTMETDANGIPRKSVAIVILVQDEDDENLKVRIAKEIFIRAGLGEEFYAPGQAGDGEYQEVQVKDSYQQITQVRFIYPKKTRVKLEIGISQIEGSPIPTDYEARIKSNIIQFVKYGVSGLGIQSEGTGNFDTFGFPVSEDVVLSRLYTPVNAVPGVGINYLKASADDGPMEERDIPIPWDGIASFAPEDITIIKL